MAKKKQSRVFSLAILSVVAVVVAIEGFLVVSTVAGEQNAAFVAAVSQAFGKGWDGLMPGR